MEQKPIVLKCKNVRMVFDSMKKTAWIWTSNTTYASRFLESLVMEKKFDHIDTIILHDNSNPELSHLIRGAEVYKFIHTGMPKEESGFLKKNFSELVNQCLD